MTRENLEPEPSNTLEVELQSLLSHAFAHPLDSDALSRLLELSENLTESCRSEVPEGPWSRTPTQTNPDAHHTLEHFDQPRGLDEDTASSENSEDESPQASVTCLLMEFQVYLNYRLFGRAHHALLEAHAIAKQVHPQGESLDMEQSLVTEITLEESMQGVERQLTIIHRLLRLSEDTEDTQIITLHTPDSAPMAAFVAHKGRICFGCVLEGHPELDDVLKQESPEVYSQLTAVEGNNLRQMQEIVGDALTPPVRIALARQMARAFLKMANLPAKKPFRIRQTKVAEPARVSTFSTVDIYREACAQLDPPQPMEEIYDCFEKECDFGASFRLISPKVPFLEHSTSKLTMKDLGEFAQAVDTVAKSARRLGCANAGFIIPGPDAFWCVHVRDTRITFSRYRMPNLGRVSNWLNLETESSASG